MILLKLKKYQSHGHYLAFYSKKSPFAATTASILDRKRRQAFATVSLSRMPITSVIFATREASVLWGALLTYDSQTPQKK